MQEIVYALRFTGRAEPAGPDGKVLTAATQAPSSVVASTVGPGGLDGRIEAAPGGAASFASQVTFTGEQAFREAGSITFGPGNVVRFATVGSGCLGPSADPARQHGAGQSAGASGLITSNFFVGADLAVVDHRFGVLLLPEEAPGADRWGRGAAAAAPHRKE